MSLYPGAQDEFRVTQNLPGILYNAADTKTVFAEDTNNHSDAIVAIEETLGINPQGTADTVVDRLDDVDTAISGKQPALGFTAEDVANKATSTSLGTSNTLYPTQNAVKSYVDTGLATKQATIGYTPEDQANKSTSTSLGTSNTLYPSQNAVKSYIDTAISTAKEALYPVGSIWTSTSVSTNPGTVLGFGTWSAFGTGRVLVSKAASGTFGSIGATGGAETHTLVTGEMPSHVHDISHTHSGTPSGSLTNTNQIAGAPIVAKGSNDSVLTGVNSGATGGGGAHNNLQPYIVVYMWERTA